MEITMNLLLMLGGVAVFMFGMKQMSQGMEQGAGSGIKKLFKKIDKNRVVNYGVGIGATALVQSSSATSIMTVGLANAGIVNVKQGAGIVLGAKVGTTLTAFLFSLGFLNKGKFSVSAVFAAVAFVGVLITYITNKESLKKIALFLTGFGMLFVGLDVMEYALGASALKDKLVVLFDYPAMQNPVMLVLLGMAFTLIIQSSTAATGIFLAFLTTGVIGTIDQSFFLVMGANIGTCSDGLMAAIGTNASGKRIAVFHALTSTIGAVLFSVILAIFRTPITDMFNRVFPSPQWSLATFNLSYNIIYTLILLACLDPLVALVSKIVRDKQPKAKQLRYIDDRLLSTPSVAIEQALKEVRNMAAMAKENLDRAFRGIMSEDMSESKLIANEEYEIDFITRSLADFFIKISSRPISARDEKLIGGLHHVINDLERVGDHAVSLAKETNYMKQLDARFLDETKKELWEIHTKISEMYELSLETFKTRRTEYLKKISELHQGIISTITEARDAHIKRLSANMYSVEVSKSLYQVLLSLHRVADHAVNMAFSIRSDTGSKTEAFAKIEAERKATS